MTAIAEPVRPEECTEEHLEYLDDLRESGRVNMMTARPVLMNALELESETARKILLYWMQTFGDRHP